MFPGKSNLGWASGTRATLRNTSSLKSPAQTPTWQTQISVDELSGSLLVGGFGSYHTGGANFAFADGAVRFLSLSIPEELLKQLGNRADGELLIGEF